LNKRLQISRRLTLTQMHGIYDISIGTIFSGLERLDPNLKVTPIANIRR